MSEKEGSVLDRLIREYVPLVDSPVKVPPGEDQAGEAGRNSQGLRQVRIPILTPDNPVVDLIRETSELTEFLDKIDPFAPETLNQVEGVIRGVLSAQAVEKVYVGYSVPIPFPVSKRDLVSLGLGRVPAVWEKKVGIQAPAIDLYVDVSGSMADYYGYIPVIYDALRFVRGRIFQFSTAVVEADPDDTYLSTSGGTDFDETAQHILENGTKAIILVSDGEGHISKPLAEALGDQLESLIYLKVRDNRYFNWEALATKVVVLERGD